MSNPLSPNLFTSRFRTGFGVSHLVFNSGHRGMVWCDIETVFRYFTLGNKIVVKGLLKRFLVWVSGPRKSHN